MARNSHLSGFGGMLEVTVATSHPYLSPAVPSDDAYGFSYFGHGLVGLSAFMGDGDYNMEGWGSNGVEGGLWLG